MAERQLPSPEVLRQLLRYEPDTGKLFWKERPLGMFGTKRACSTWNARYAGNEALIGDNGVGYRVGRIFDRPFLAHRVIWAIYFGQWPESQIDHINRDRADNRLENLRSATPAQNQFNQPKQSNNTSGFKGVFFDKRRGSWFAAIREKGRNIHLGTFECPLAAAKAYDCAARERHGEFAHVNFADLGQCSP